MMTALSDELDSRQGARIMGNVHGPISSNGHVLIAAGLVLVGAFVATAGAGGSSGFVISVGVGIAISAVVYAAYTVARRRLASMVNGTAHVVSAGAPPASATHGRCEMHLVVQAPQLAAIAVRHRDQSTPVAKWPTPGASVPVKVDPRDPRDLRILWEQVRPHGQTPVRGDRRNDKPAANQDDGGRASTLETDEDANVAADSHSTAGLGSDNKKPPSHAGDTKDGPKPLLSGEPNTALNTTIEPPPGLLHVDDPDAKPPVLLDLDDPDAKPPVLLDLDDPDAKPPVLLDLDDDPAPQIGLATNSRPADVLGGADSSAGLSLLGGADDEFDLSFLDSPTPTPHHDPLLEEYGSPVREVGVTLIVSDIHRSLTFYRDVLGFFEIESGPDMVLLEARTGRVVLRQRVDAQAQPPRLMHLTLEVNDIESAHRTLGRRGVEFVDEPRPVLKGELLELWAVSFHDPDGHGVALTCWRPRDED